MTPAERRHRTFLGAVALGVAIRAVDFLNCRSLGLDEARLAVNIASRSFLGLLQPLDMDQSAPPLFLWGERLALLVFGPRDCPLRLLPVTAGIVATVLMYPLAKRFLEEDRARLAALIGIFSPLLITYSNALKQYSFELLVAVLLLLLLERAVRDDLRIGLGGVAVAAGTLAPWLALTSVFVLVVGWLLLAVRAARERGSALRLMLATTVLWGASGLAAYLAIYHAARRNPYMQRFWELAFVRPDRPGFLRHFWKTLEDLVWGFVAGDPLVDRRPFLWMLHIGSVVVLVLCALGILRLTRARGWAGGAWLWGPAFAVFVASALGVFPIAPRLTLFMLPGLVILFIAGMDEALAHAGRGIRRHRLAIAMLVFVLPMEFQAVVRTFALEPSGRFPQLVAALRRHRGPGEPVYIFARTLPAWIFYSTDWARPDTARLGYLMRAAAAGGFAFENAPSRGRVHAAEVDAARPAPQAPYELLGLPSGMEWREVQEHIGSAPDSGWVEIEKRRIEEAANPGIWVIATTYYEPETRLFKVLERDAERRTFAELRAGSALARYEFSRSPRHDAAQAEVGRQ